MVRMCHQSMACIIVHEGIGIVNSVNEVSSYETVSYDGKSQRVRALQGGEREGGTRREAQGKEARGRASARREVQRPRTTRCAFCPAKVQRLDAEG